MHADLVERFEEVIDMETALLDDAGIEWAAWDREQMVRYLRDDVSQGSAGNERGFRLLQQAGIRAVAMVADLMHRTTVAGG